MIKKLLSLFGVFFKVGVIGFGGGSALIPVVEKEVVENKKWFDEEAYLKHTVIANITPGALPVKLGAIAGYEKAGGLGSVLAAYAVTLPGIILTILLLTLFSVAGESIAHYIEFASVGIAVFIINLLLIYVLKVMQSGKANNLYKANITICVISFLLTGGKEIRQIIYNIVGHKIPELQFILFDIATIDLIILAFFMIFFVGLLKGRTASIIGFIVSLAYAIVKGKNGWVAEGSILPNLLSGLMVILVVFALMKSRKKATAQKAKLKLSKQLFIAIALYLFIPIVLLVSAKVMMPVVQTDLHTPIQYTGDVAISTVTSFGGGEAYVSVADGLFIQTGYVEASDYYNKIIAIANALPGPILVKVAAGIGYLFGGTLSGVAFGWLIAALGMATAVGACCIVALIVLVGYDALKDSPALLLLKQYILPVVCGMLISTSLSMIIEAMKITGMVGVSGVVAFPILIATIGILYWIHKKYHVNDIIMLLGSAGLSFMILNFIK